MTDKEVMDRIARGPDGPALYRRLQEVLCSICHDRNEGALRHHEGRRSLAADLMADMAEGIGSDRRDAPIIPAGRTAEQPKRKLTAREWIATQPRWSDDAPGEPDAVSAKPS